MSHRVYNPLFINHIVATLNNLTESTTQKIRPNHCVRYLDNKYYIEIEMPGVDPETLKILVKGDEINVDAKKFHLNQLIDEKVKPSDVNVNYKTGMFSYKIKLPYCIKNECITSYYMWGILTFEIIPTDESGFTIDIIYT